MISTAQKLPLLIRWSHGATAGNTARPSASRPRHPPRCGLHVVYLARSRLNHRRERRDHALSSWLAA